MNRLDASDWFARRHIGPSREDRDRMLETIGAASLDALIDEAIPASIRLERPLNLPPPESEHHYLRRLGALARRNTRSAPTSVSAITTPSRPSVILRMVMENPGLVHAVHAVPGRDRAGPPRIAPQFPDDGGGADGDGGGQRVAAGRGDGGGRGDDAAAPRRARSNGQRRPGPVRPGGTQPLPRQRSLPAADDRRAAVRAPNRSTSTCTSGRWSR